MAKKNSSTQYEKSVNIFTKPYGSKKPLIFLVGTMGGVKAGGGSYTFPYSGIGNQMWCLLPALFGEPSLIGKSDKEKERFLEEHNIAMYDVCKSALRKGSGDNSIKNEVVNDFDAIVKQYPDAKIICVGNQSYTIFSRHFPHISSAKVISTSGSVVGKSCKEKLISFRNAFNEKCSDLNDVQTILKTVCSNCTRKNKF